MARKNSLRLPYYDYRQGWFLITTTTYRRLPLLGAIAGDALHLSPLGEFVAEAWAFTAAGKPGIAEHAFLLMPDHLHAVVGLAVPGGRPGAGRHARDLAADRTFDRIVVAKSPIAPILTMSQG